MLIWISRIFGVAAAAVLVSDILSWMASGSFRLTALGEWWFWAHPGSLQVLQPAVERHVEQWLPFTIWDPGIQTLLEWSFAAELAVISALFWLFAMMRRRAQNTKFVSAN